jgi:polyhydroxyalkanoate synthesis regulator phasin
MGELKNVATEQTKLVERVKNIGQQFYLANLGLVSKVEEEGKKQIDKLVVAGEQARGEKAAATAKPVLAALGLVEVLKEEAQKLSADSLKAQFEELKTQLTTLNLKEESLKLFDDLVAAGEKRKAA